MQPHSSNGVDPVDPSEVDGDSQEGPSTRDAQAKLELLKKGLPKGIPAVINWARIVALGLPHTHGAILKDLSYFADEDGWCYPSQDLLAVITGKSRGVVSELMLELESVNILISELRREQRGYHKRYRLMGYLTDFRADYPDPESFGLSVGAQMRAMVQEARRREASRERENVRLRQLLIDAGIDQDIIAAAGVDVPDAPEGSSRRLQDINPETGEIFYYYEDPKLSVGNVDTQFSEGPEAPVEPDLPPEIAALHQQIDEAVPKYWEYMRESPENPKGWPGQRLARRWYKENKEHQDRFLEQLEIWETRAAKDLREDGAAQEATSAVKRLSGEPDPEAERVWGEVLEKLRLQVPRPSFETWLKDTVGHTVTDSEMMVLAPTQNTAEWLERRMYQSVFRAVEQVLGRPVEVQFLLRGFDG